ncbi:MAG TPA: acyl-CoA dehydrogenase family protein, partial [Pirellulaceae bacterium]|nr:acyl-CoA dehydrogenase family protein [Pirellulaceae bacterium]
MAVDREKQLAEAEELLGAQPPQRSFAKGLFFGEYLSEALLPYPDWSHHPEANEIAQLETELRTFCREQIDPNAIDRQAEIPDSVIAGLGRLGVLGACLPKSCGGRELSQTSYCRVLELLGGHCGSTALFVNAHHSIGPRAIVLFGSPAQQERYLPKLATGEWISAFALTEPEAGSDAANVQTTATPTEDGRGYIINGQKRWITNGGVAQVLTLMARTPVPGSKETKITAFIVTPDTPGFQVIEKRMEKLGVRGTATARLAFENMFVPRENILGQLGKGLKIALTTLDFGRTTFGASCTGAAKFCVEKARQHVLTRVQFGEPLANFEMVQEKIAAMQAGAYAMEACTYQTAAFMDSGEGDFMLETAMLKVFSTEVLWKIINDTFQLHGGKAYFTDEPYERMLRDARINMIGEGANDVLRAFSALVGLRDVGKELEGILHAVQAPLGSNLVKLGRFTGKKLGALLTSPA